LVNRAPLGIPKWQILADGRYLLFSYGLMGVQPWSRERAEVSSFPWIGLDRSGTTVRRVPLPNLAGYFEVSYWTLQCVKSDKEKPNGPEHRPRQYRPAARPVGVSAWWRSPMPAAM